MKFITCGIAWGGGEYYNFRELSKYFKIAILGQENNNSATFQKVILGKDYIALKRGFQTFALGKAKGFIQNKTWADIEKMCIDEGYRPTESEQKLFSKVNHQHQLIDFIEVEE